jgi:hypothetical protein
MQNSNGMQKNLKIHAVSMTPHARCMWYQLHRMQNMTPHARSTNDSNERPWQPLKGISIKKTYMFPNCPTLPLKKDINLKGLRVPNKKFSCMRCH